MQYELLQKPDFGMIKVSFEQAGEKMRVESSSMVARSTELEMETSMQGGLLAAAKRKMLGGESLFQNTFTSTGPGQTLYVAPGPEGDVESFELNGSNALMMQSGAFFGGKCRRQSRHKMGWGKRLF